MYVFAAIVSVVGGLVFLWDRFMPAKKKYVDYEYAEKVGLIDKYKNKGYKPAWAYEHKACSMIEVEGWKYAYIRNPFWRKNIMVREDKPYNLVLVVKKDEEKK